MNKTMYSKQICKNTFYGESVKDAYMRACKWYATNIIAKDKMHNISVEFIKDIEKKAVTIKLYAMIGEDEIMSRHCECCKNMHHSFFINEDTHCDRCSAVSFQRRLEQSIAAKVEYCKSLLRKINGQ